MLPETLDILPNHIGIIMDGNGRWAQSRGKSRFMGHRAGHTSVLRVVRECRRLNIATLTLFAFSSENWRRPQNEVDALMLLFSQAIKRNRSLFLKHQIRFCMMGDLQPFSDKLRQQITQLETETAHFTEMRVNIAANYGGRWDIVQACQQACAEIIDKKMTPNELDEKLLTQYICPPSELDLLIRTGGEQRISNFLLWQASYAELYFTPVLWPDFDETQLHHALTEFARRERRFGGLKS